MSSEVLVDETPLSSTTLTELGLTVLEKPKILVDSDQRARPNLPAIPEHVPGASRLLSDLLDLASLVNPNPDREKARDEFRRRLVRNADRRVHYAAIEFEPRVQSNGDVHAEAFYAFIPEEVIVNQGTDEERKEIVVGLKPKKVVPFYYAGPEFLKPIGNGKYISGGTFQCILFEPDTKNGPYKALPLGMAHPKTIATYNDVAKRRNDLPGFKNEPWPIIHVIEHELRRPGVRRVRFIPRFDLAQHLQSGSKKRQLLGCHFGQPVYLAAKSTVPEPDECDGIKGFFEKHLFRVKRLGEKSIEVVWLGKASDVPVEDRLTVEDIRNEMNPFEVLGTTPTYVNWNTIDQSTRKWVNGSRPYDEKNPVYVAALELGFVHKTDETILVRAHLEELWKEAVRLLRVEMMAASDVARRHLTIAPTKPTETEIRGNQKSHKALLLDLNQPHDAVAIWISRVFDKPFDPSSPFLMHLRAWFINTYAPEKGLEQGGASQTQPVLVPVLVRPTAVPQEDDQPPPLPTKEDSRPFIQVNENFKPLSESPGQQGVIVIQGDELQLVDDEQPFVEPEDTFIDHSLDHPDNERFEKKHLAAARVAISNGSLIGVNRGSVLSTSDWTGIYHDGKGPPQRKP